MSEQRSMPGSRRARPVAELAFEPLLDRTREISRRWAIALIVDSPLDSLGAVPLEELAREAPELVSALLGALRSNAELDQLLGGGRSGQSHAVRVAAMAGVDEPVGVVEAVEALRGALWEALLDEFGTAAPELAGARQLTDLSDRLAYVCSAMLPVALAGVATAPGPPPAAGNDAPAPPAPSAGARPARPGVTIVDEQAASEPPVAWVPAMDLPGDGAVVGEPATKVEIQIRDERGDEGPAAWIRSIGRQLERFEEDRSPFSVLLVELRGEASKQAEFTWEPLEVLLAEELSAAGGGTMTREREGRYWLLAPGIDRLGAGELAAQLGRMLDSYPGQRQLQLSVAVGTAVCPEDGRRASALAAHADVGLYAARSERHLMAPAEGRQVS
jgi:hypothetical protein